MKEGNYQFDEESHLYQVRFRYLHPNLGRWMSRDPIGVMGGLNAYAYVKNNPINLADPSGLAEKEVGKCEIYIYAGHGSKTDPIKWKLDPCSFAGAASCWPDRNNSTIPESQRLWGTPMHDQPMNAENKPLDVTQKQRMSLVTDGGSNDPNPEQGEVDSQRALANMIQGAGQAALQLCAMGCESVKYTIEINMGNDYVPNTKDSFDIKCCPKKE